MSDHELEENETNGLEIKEDLELVASESDEDEGYTWISPDCPPELSEQFDQYVKAYHEAPETTHFRQLEAHGVELPAPETMDDQQLTAKLWEIIEALAEMRVFVTSTDHLSDRELYTDLWQEVLHEIVTIMPFDESSSYHIDLVSSGSEEDIHLHLKYYADEEYRQYWAKQWPNDEIPEHEQPPFDRDRNLPQSNFGRPEEEPDEVM